MRMLNLPLPLLQIQLQDFRPREADPGGSLMFLLCFGIFIVILIIISIIRNGIGATGLSGQKTRSAASSHRQYSIFKMRKVANDYRLDRDQVKLLEYVFRNEGVADPAAVMANTASLDRIFKRAYKSIERRAASEDELQNFLTILFSIRNIAEFAQGRNPPAASTRNIAENSSAVVTSARQENFSVSVLSSRGDNLLVECPRNTIGTPIRFGTGQRVKISFFTNSSKGFSFDTKVVGTVDTPRGLALSLSHSSQVNNSMVQRRYKRLEVSIPSEFFMVNIQDVKVGRKMQKKMTVAPQRYRGSIQNISLGGCALKTGSNIQAGSRIKITFENDEDLKIAALGLVLRTNRSGAAAMTLHVKFLKVPRKSQNAVSAMVFEYDQ